MAKIRWRWWLVAAVLVGGLVGCGGAQPNKNKDYDRPKASGRG